MRVFARQMTERMKAVAAAGAVAAFWLAVWVLVAGLVAQPLILPGPGAVVVSLLRLACDGGTWAILVGSGARILGGLALAAVCGGVLAGASVRSRTFARLVAPALSFVKATPVAEVSPLLPKAIAWTLTAVPSSSCEHRGSLFDGSAGRVFFAGRGFGTGE